MATGITVFDRKILPKLTMPIGILMPCGAAVIYHHWWDIPPVTTFCPCGEWDHKLVWYTSPSLEEEEPYGIPYAPPEGEEESCEPCGDGPCFCADVGRPCKLCGVR